ncbi:6764_t:CDS:2, partial [Dentiscutata heterogama]
SSSQLSSAAASEDQVNESEMSSEDEESEFAVDYKLFVKTADGWLPSSYLQSPPTMSSQMPLVLPSSPLHALHTQVQLTQPQTQLSQSPQVQLIQPLLPQTQLSQSPQVQLTQSSPQVQVGQSSSPHAQLIQLLPPHIQSTQVQLAQPLSSQF